MSDYRFPDHPGKDPAETLKVRLSLFNLCANFWAANEQFDLNEMARPNLATGFAYQATIAGTSGAREPAWPRTLGLTKTDGSVTWTCVAASVNGLDVISSPSAVSDPTGLTISAVSVSESTEILASYAGGIQGQTYDAVFTFTLNGVTRIARQRVPVVKR